MKIISDKIEYGLNMLYHQYSMGYKEYQRRLKKNPLYKDINKEKADKVLSETYPPFVINDYLIETFTGISKWLEYKIVYDIDIDLLALLSDSDFPGLPFHYLSEMPFPAFFINFPIERFGYTGVFVFYNQSLFRNDEVYFIFLNETKPFRIFAIEIGNYNKNEIVKPITDENDVNKETNLLSETLTILAYIFSEGSEVQKRQRINYGRAVHKETDIFEVGFNIGQTVRNYKYEQSERHDTDEYLGGTKRPHLRKAHWHSYWTGPRDEPENRKKIIKWIAPVVVGTDNEDEILPTIKKVK